MISIRILSIDPGSSHVGFAVLDLTNTNRITLKHVETFNPNKHLLDVKDVIEQHGPRFARILKINQFFYELMELYKPDIIVCEAPFYNRLRPGAFKALVEVISSLQHTVYDYDPSVMFHTTDPSTVKKSVGVKGTSGDKEAIRSAISHLNIFYGDTIALEVLDEHSVDAIAVGYSKAIDLINHYWDYL